MLKVYDKSKNKKDGKGADGPVDLKGDIKFKADGDEEETELASEQVKAAGIQEVSSITFD